MGKAKISQSDLGTLIASRITDLLEAKGMSIRALARATGRSPKYLNLRLGPSAENDLTVGDVALVCDALDISIDQLLQDNPRI